MTRNRLTRWTGVALLLASVSWSHAQPPPSANELVVEAGRLIMAAESAPTPVQAIDLLEEAHRKLVVITEVHPASDMAVKLATGQGIGTISLAGVQAAIKAATERCWTSLSLVCVARLTFEAAMLEESVDDREQALSVVAKGQAAAGQFSAAVKTAQLMVGFRSRVETLSAIAAAQSKAGQAEEVQISMDKLVAEATAIEDVNDRSDRLYHVVSAQAEAEQFSTAIETAASIDSLSGRTEALLVVAAAQSKAGQDEDARTTANRAADTARSIRNLYDRAHRLSDVARAYIEMGAGKAARATIEAATAAVLDRQAYHQALTWTTVAATHTKAGNMQAARATIRQTAEVATSLQDAGQRTGRLWALVSAGVDAEQFIEAAQVAELFTVPYDRACALVDVALAQVKAGQIEPARVTIEMAGDFAQSVDEPFERAYARALIANVQTTIGDTPDRTTTALVVEAAQALQNAYDRTRLFALISQAQTEAGHIDDARATIKLADDPVTRIDDPIEQAHALALVAWAHADGEFDSAQDTIVRAVEAAVSLKDTNQRATRLQEMASAYAKAGHFAEAVATAMLIEAARGQAWVLANIASAQAEAGTVEGARETITRAAETATSNSVDAHVLAIIAAAQAKAGLGEAAQATFREAFQDIESKSYWYPGYMLAEVALAQATAGQSEAARATIDQAIAAVQAEGAASRASALTAIATTQTTAGSVAAARQTLTTAFEAAQAIEDVDTQLRRFFEIAAAQTTAGSARDARVTVDTAFKHFKAAQKDWGLARTFIGDRGIAKVPLEADQLAEVIAIVKSPEFEDAHGGIGLYTLASSLASSGASGHVMEILKLVEDIGTVRISSVLGDLVSGQVKATQFAEALKTARLIEDPMYRSAALAEIALAQAKGGQVKAARATIGLATEAVRSSRGVSTLTLVNLAKAQVAAGLVWEAKSTLREALQEARSESQSDFNPWPSWSLRRILAVLSEMHEDSLL